MNQKLAKMLRQRLFPKGEPYMLGKSRGHFMRALQVHEIADERRMPRTLVCRSGSPRRIYRDAKIKAKELKRGIRRN